MLAQSKKSDRRSWTIAAGAGSATFAAFVVWGGIPRDDRAVLFWAQMLGLFLLSGAFALLFWHLFLRPLAAKLSQPKPDNLPSQLRQRIALMQTGGIMAIFVGAFWDELWHRSYGIPFGEDFFWRPHLLIYFGVCTVIGVGFWALLYLNRQLKGNFQQRFRANPLIGLFILNAAFMLYALTSDPFWHWTFGEDLTAWSLPHLIMLLSFIFTLLLAAFVYVSTLPLREWRGLSQLNFRDALPLLIFAGNLLVWLQLMLIDWDQALAGIKPEWLGLYRPEWLLAANLTACVTLTGIVATRLLRCAGAATAAGLLALAIRYAMIQIFQADSMQYAAWLAALLPLLGIDLWAYYCGLRRQQEPAWRGSALAIGAAMLLNAPIIRGLYNFDGVNMADNLAYALAVFVTVIGLSWLSQQIADAMLRQRQREAVAPSAPVLLRPAFSFGLLGSFVLFIIFFIATASPPV